MGAADSAPLHERALMCASEPSLANMVALKSMIRERAPLIASMFVEPEDADDGTSVTQARSVSVLE